MVRDELCRAKAPRIVRNWIARPPPWLAIEFGEALSQPSLQTLDEGEKTTIALAAMLGSPIIVMDDRAGVVAARSQGYTVTGTLGLLIAAARGGLVDLPLAITRLRKTSFRIRQDILDRLLAELT